MSKENTTNDKIEMETLVAQFFRNDFNAVKNAYDMETLVDQFFRNGYLVVNHAYDLETIEECKKHWPWDEDCYTKERLTGKRLFGTLMHKKKIVLPKDYRKNKLVHALANLIFERGSMYDEVENGFINSVPGTKAQRWHRDDYNSMINEKELRHMLVLTPLKHVEVEMGFPEFLPGSHLESDRMMEPLEGEAPITACIQPGDALFIHGSVVHRGTANITENERVLLWTRFTTNV